MNISGAEHDFSMRKQKLKLCSQAHIFRIYLFLARAQLKQINQFI